MPDEVFPSFGTGAGPGYRFSVFLSGTGLYPENDSMKFPSQFAHRTEGVQRGLREG